jgi:integrator complex subunit 6
MTIIVFLVDTSASMNQRAFVNGRKTLLDISKEAVEVFVKQRQKSADCRGDRYMLLTFDEFPRNIKAGWKENLATFMAELKNLEASGMSTLGSALKAVFDTLNINRMQSGIDMYGQGRYPYYLEPAVIVVVTDGGKLTTATSVQRELNLPMTAGAGMGGMSGVPGAELTREPFRWDQRLYALVLRMAGHPPMSAGAGESGHVASDNSPVDAMCEVTGGRSYAVTSNRVLHQVSVIFRYRTGTYLQYRYGYFVYRYRYLPTVYTIPTVPTGTLAFRSMCYR